MKHRRLVAVVCLLSALLSISAAAVPQADLDQAIDLSLRQAELRTVLEAFARIAGGELDLPPDVEGAVTVELASVPWKRALHQVCVMNGLSCYWSEFAGPKLVVRRSDGFRGMAESIDMSLRAAPLDIVLQAMDTVAGEDFAVELDPEISGTTDIEIASTPWPVALERVCRQAPCRLTWSPKAVRVDMGEPASSPGPVADTATQRLDIRRLLTDQPDLELRLVEILDRAGDGSLPIRQLDALCAEAGCRWTERWGDPPRLELRPAEPAKVTKEVADDPPAGRGGDPTFGAEPVVLRASMTSNSGLTETRDLRFDWNTPSHSLGPSAEPAAARVRLAWLPFTAQHQALLAFTVACDAGAGTERFFVWPPISLPLSQVWTQTSGRVQASIGPSPAAEGSGTDARTPCTDPAAAFQVVLQDPARPPVPSMPSLPMEPGNYLMVTPRPTGGGPPAPAAAVVYLGTEPDGSRALAVVRAGDSETPPSVERFHLAVGATWQRTLGDAAIELRVTAD